MSRPRLLVAISAHGLGHLAQAAPVCNALALLQPDTALTIWSALPIQTLRQRITVPFVHEPTDCDIGFVMHDALNVDVPASWQRYKSRDLLWNRHLATARATVRRHHPDLILSDIADMALAAGQALNIPTVAMSSLNWADMARFYFSDIQGSSAIIDRLTVLYDNTTLALRLSPGMPMRGQREEILPPIGGVTALSRTEIEKQLVAELTYPTQPRLLVGLGGITTILPLGQWPKQTALNLLVANQKALLATGDRQRGIINADTLRARHNWNFYDLLAASDTVICKPGYGTFVEAALAGLPVLYVKRNKWPEQTILIDWLQQNTCCAELTMDDLQQGNFEAPLARLMAQPRKPAIARDGAILAARKVQKLMQGALTT